MHICILGRGKSEPGNWHMDKVNKHCRIHTREDSEILSSHFFSISSIDHIQQTLFNHLKKASVGHMLLFCGSTEPYSNFSFTSVTHSVDIKKMSEKCQRNVEASSFTQHVTFRTSATLKCSNICPVMWTFVVVFMWICPVAYTGSSCFLPLNVSCFHKCSIHKYVVSKLFVRYSSCDMVEFWVYHCHYLV